MRTKIASLAAIMLLTACQSNGTNYDNNPNTYKGAAIGATIGAVTGAIIGKDEGDKWRKGAIGAGIGAVAGGGFGQYMDQQEAQMRKDLEGSGVEVKRDGDNILLNMPNSITFDTAKSVVKPEFSGTLSSIANVLKQYPQTKVDVVGHTDSVGNEAYNQALSENRARAVVGKLVEFGVDSSRLIPYGMGETTPIADNNTEAGKAQNRRVEVKITPVAQPQIQQQQ